MIPFLIDVTIIGIIVFCAWRGYKNGLIRGVFGIVSLIVALLVANVAAQAYSKEAKDVLMPFASGLIDSTLAEMRENDIEYQEIAHNHEIDDLEIDDYAFGTAYTVLRQIGLPEAAAVVIATQTAGEVELAESNQFSYAFIETLADKLTDSLSFAAVYGIAFLIMAILLAVAGNLLGFVFSLPGLKLVDVIAGSALGLVKGIIIVFAISVIIRYYGILALSTIERTSLLSNLINNNPIANLLGI